MTTYNIQYVSQCSTKCVRVWIKALTAASRLQLHLTPHRTCGLTLGTNILLEAFLSYWPDCLPACLYACDSSVSLYQDCAGSNRALIHYNVQWSLKGDPCKETCHITGWDSLNIAALFKSLPELTLAIPTSVYWNSRVLHIMVTVYDNCI